MKKRSRTIILCEIFRREWQACFPELPKGTRLIWLEAALHADLPALETAIRGAVEEARSEDGELVLMYGTGCHPELAAMVKDAGIRCPPAKNCIEAFCGKRMAELEANRTMIMTPGWVRAWPEIMAALGWDEVDVRINLGRYDRILILEPGLDPLSDEEIITFFDLVQVPVEVEPLDLSHFRKMVESLLG